MGAEHEPAVGFSFGEEDFAFEDEVGEFLLGDEEEFLVAGEVKLAVDDLDLAPFVGVGPTCEGFAVGKRGEAVFVLGLQRESQCETGE